MSKESEDFPEWYMNSKKEFLDFLAKSDHEQSYHILKGLFYYPGSVRSEPLWSDALQLFLKQVKAWEDETLEDLLESIIDDPTNTDALFDLAYELYEQQAYGIAATILKKADEIKPDNAKIVDELVSNLEALMLNKEACNILLNAKKSLENNEMTRYLNGYNHLMIGNIEVPTKMLPTIQDSIDETIKFTAESLKGMLDRVNVLKKTRPLDNRDLRGWHMVLNGTILLHYSPFALHEGMHGRYAYISDSPSLCKDGINRIKEVIKYLNLDIHQVIALPDRSSQILALATSKILNLPLVEYLELDKEQEGLIVAYDFEEVGNEEILRKLRYHSKGEVLWVHASCWTYPFLYAPDITTYLYQNNASFWGGERISVNIETNKIGYTDPDGSPIEDIASEIINAKIDDEYVQDFDDLLLLTKNLSELEGYSKAGIHKEEGIRLRQRLGSPVPSNRFMM